MLSSQGKYSLHHGQRSLASCSPWVAKESHTTEELTVQNRHCRLLQGRSVLSDGCLPPSLGWTDAFVKCGGVKLTEMWRETKHKYKPTLKGIIRFNIQGASLAAPAHLLPHLWGKAAGTQVLEG